MSALKESAVHRSYPLSPSPNSELRKSQTASFQLPRTPQSPLRSQSVTEEAQDRMSPTMSTTQETTAGQEDLVMPVDATLQDESLKRKRESGDTGDSESKKVHVEGSKLCIEDLHDDVGKIYQLCRTRKTPMSTFLLSLCGHFDLEPYGSSECWLTGT